MATESYPRWTPADLVEWIDGMDEFYPKSHSTLSRRLATDERMRQVWEWYERVREHLPSGSEQYSWSLVGKVDEAMKMPNKPGNMSPKKRAQYFDRVRHHAEELINLLSDTHFDRAWDGAREVNKNSPDVEHNVARNVLMTQYIVDSDPKCSHIPVAFSATAEGLYSHDWGYPESHLVQILHEVGAWTRGEDLWGRGQLLARNPVRQTGPAARVINFNCRLYDEIARLGVEIPFSILATLANVALELPPDRQIDEDTARKQVRRHLDRVGDNQPMPPKEDSDTPF